MRGHELMQNVILDTPYEKNRFKDLDAFDNIILRGIWASHCCHYEEETIF
jgi:hypothetical protein